MINIGALKKWINTTTNHDESLLEYSRQPLQMSRTEGHVQNAKGFKS
jgi:hypothetical protein